MVKWVLLAFQFLLWGVRCELDAAGYLYGTTNEPVMEYTGKRNDFLDPVNLQNFRVVLFYSPNCPHCVDFRPEYTKLSRDTTNLYNIWFYAVSCDQHREVCLEFGISSVPSMYVFGSGDKKGKHVKEPYSPSILAKELGVESEAMNNRHMDVTIELDDQFGEDGPDDIESADGEDSEENSYEATVGTEDEDLDVESENFGSDSAEKEDDDDGNASHEQGDFESGAEDLDSYDRWESGDATSPEQSDNGTENPGQESFDEGESFDAGPYSYHSGEYEESDEDPGYEDFVEPDVGRGKGPFRNFGAGHMKARDQYKDMDRFRDEVRQHRKEFKRRRKGLGRLVASNRSKDTYGKSIERTNLDDMTKTMKVNTPGTAEFKERKKKVLEHFKKAQGVKRKNFEHATKLALSKEALPYTKDVRKPTFVREKIEKLPILKRIVKMTAEEELILDATLSLVVSLESGVYTSVDQNLSKTQKRALTDFLDLLSVSLPPEWGIHKMIDALRSKIDYISQGDTNLRNIIKKYPLPRRQWSKSCTVRNPHGFSCGLWKLFHVVTVGVAEHRGGLNLIESEMMGLDTKTFSPIEAADTLRNYIENFFSCAKCRRNFLTKYDDCANNRRCDRLTDNEEDASIADWKELAIWLWEVHNEVSIDILKDKAKKELHVGDEIKVVWPNIGNCFMCFTDEGTWDEEQVFKFLEKSYWPDSDVDPGEDRLLTFEGEKTSGLGSILIAAILLVVLVYKAIGSNSPSIQRSVLIARQMVASGTPGRKKIRSH